MLFPAPSPETRCVRRARPHPNVFGEGAKGNTRGRVCSPRPDRSHRFSVGYPETPVHLINREKVAAVDCAQLAAAVGPASLLAGVNQELLSIPGSPPCPSKLRASQRQQAARSPRMADITAAASCRPSTGLPEFSIRKEQRALVKTRNSENAVGRLCKTRFTRGVRKRRAQARLCHHVPSLH